MDENDAITYTTEGLAEGDTLGVNEKDTLSVTVAYNPEVTSQPTNTAKDITVTINYVQDLGDTGNVMPTGTYSIGDTVSFAGSNWYVIKDSTADEDYVTLMKATVLTNAELGEYAYNDTNGSYDTMSYYWSDTCHSSGYYGYTDNDSSGCAGHNDYEGSKVREYLEGTYINKLGADNLKEIDGYQVRLVTFDELLGNLGYSMDITSGGVGENPDVNDNVPTWVYGNFGENQNGVDGYWTMTQKSTINSAVWRVHSSGLIYNNDILANTNGIRPVINLLKSSI